MPIVKNKSGLEKVFVDNLEELGDLSARTDITDSTTATFLKCDTNGVLEVNNTNSKITQGYDTTVAAGGDGLQQVLIYGRENGGDLRALECNGDRLLVDVVELAQSGPISTSTSLSSVQTCGYDTGTSQFKTMKVDSDGVLNTSNSKITQGEDSSIASGGNGLQQILCYGKDQSGDLDALNVDNNGHLKITLNDIESGITASIKTEIQGEDSGNTAHTIRTTTDGRIETKLVNTDKDVNVYTSQALAGNAEWGTTISSVGYNKVRIQVSSNATTALIVSGSDSASGTYVYMDSIFPSVTQVGSGPTNENLGHIVLEPAPNYIKIKNTVAGGVTLDILTIAST